ncbi:Alpha/Beta hydrolase protein [Pelagophyceae sp. CCMP2097]|nr:Alpha/Beta hydrolase protein [Pelagophyceae sp. CCMP2097]|mmetsp:Transcript_3914/g.12040  ORF Transcript_3914/g.12040 Transcript_3914/m.12040 type:complete len:282 (+) Transcript_3914:131-976(+)
MQSLVNSLAFPAPRLPLSFYQDGLMKRKDLIWLRTTEDEPIPAVHVLASGRGASDAPGLGLTILYSHGNAEDIGLHLPFLDALCRVTGADVLSYEYVGYSLSRFSQGCAPPCEASALRSVDAAWRYLTTTCGVSPSRIVIYGRSIGSGPAVDLASRTVSGCDASPLECRGLFLQSPIESAIRCALGYVSSLTLYSIDIFCNYEKMPLVRCPVAVVHGTADAVAPLHGGRNLHGQAMKPFAPMWLDGFSHNDVPYDKVFQYLRDFLRSLKAMELLKAQELNA